MRYLSGAAREDGCVFCNRLIGNDDVASLILYRAEHSFVIMNLFPYSSGHIMIVPNAHAADPADLDRATRHEMADLLPMMTNVLRRTLNCEGFNSGFNFGEAGGAGIAEHLHQHVVPRWVGDANFMPVIASTKVIPEMIPVGYSKIRAEIEREMTGDNSCTVVALVDDDRSVRLIDGTLPVITADSGVSIWRSAVLAVAGDLDEIEVAGWAGSARATPPFTPALVLRGSPTGQGPGEIVPIETAFTRMSSEQREVIERGLRQLAPRQ